MTQGLILIDNYDSFTYNLAHCLQDVGAAVEVVRNDARSVSEILAHRPRAVVISPGPGSPDRAGICLELIRSAPMDLPIFGVCLGMQAIAAAFGGRITMAARVVHGKTSQIRHMSGAMFANIPERFPVVRYHSLAVSRSDLPHCLTVEAETTEDDEIMALSHTERPVMGIQFHPESHAAASYGKTILHNIVSLMSHGE